MFAIINRKYWYSSYQIETLRKLIISRRSDIGKIRYNILKIEIIYIRI